VEGHPKNAIATRADALYEIALDMWNDRGMPSWDRMGFAVGERHGMGSLAEIRERRLPLRISVRGADTDTTRFVVDEVLAAHGFSLQDVESWGGSLHRSGNPLDAGRRQGIADGSIDAVFDEGIGVWAHLALEHGMRLLPIGPEAERHMVEVGWEIKPIPRGWDAPLQEDVPAIDFSGWPMFTRADLPDEIVYRICQAIDGAKARIPWDTEHSVTLADICDGNEAAPLGAPLHPGAERYYRDHGALK